MLRAIKFSARSRTANVRNAQSGRNKFSRHVHRKRLELENGTGLFANKSPSATTSQQLKSFYSTRNFHLSRNFFNKFHLSEVKPTTACTARISSSLKNFTIIRQVEHRLRSVIISINPTMKRLRRQRVFNLRSLGSHRDLQCVNWAFHFGTELASERNEKHIQLMDIINIIDSSRRSLASTSHHNKLRNAAH